MCVILLVLYEIFLTRQFTEGRVDRQRWILGFFFVLVVAVVVMGLAARGCQVGGAVSLRISQDQPTPTVIYVPTIIDSYTTRPDILVTQPAWEISDGEILPRVQLRRKNPETEQPRTKTSTKEECE